MVESKVFMYMTCHWHILANLHTGKTRKQNDTGGCWRPWVRMVCWGPRRLQGCTTVVGMGRRNRPVTARALWPTGLGANACLHAPGGS